MTEPQHIQELKHTSAEKGKDPKSRTFVAVVTILALLVMGGLLGYWINATFQEKQKAKTLAEQIASACRSGDFGPGISFDDEKTICKNAQKVIENQGEIQDKEIQEREIQEPEIQEPEIQNPENQNKETQEPEDQEAETQDPETQDAEEQEPEIQDDETQDPEIDDPDPNDPDPNDPPAAVGTYSCPEKHYMTSITFDQNGSVSVTCEELPLGPGNSGGQ